MLPGGGGFTKQTTGLKCNIPNIFDIVGSLWVKTKDLDQVMYHPFMIKTKIWYKLISWSMISSFLFYKIDKNGNCSKLFPADIQQAIWNDDYHHIFHRLNFYVLEAVKQWAMIKWKNLLNPESYRKFVKNNEYSYVLDYLDDKDIEIASLSLGITICCEEFRWIIICVLYQIQMCLLCENP